MATKVTQTKAGNKDKGKSTAMVPATKRTKEESAAYNQKIADLARLGFEALANVEGGASMKLEEAGMVEKPDLKEVPMIILDVDRRPGDFGPDSFYLIVTVLPKGYDEPVKFIDGGVGISEQIAAMTEGTFHVAKPILCSGGLRVSTYDHPEYGPGETWYLSGRKSRDEIKAELNGRNRQSARA